MTTFRTTASFSSRLTDEHGPVRKLLGPGWHAELLISHVTGHDAAFNSRLTWTPGFVRDRGKIARGDRRCRGPVVAAPRARLACPARRMDGHARAARIAAALGDDLTVVGVG
ncbi:hypothetical protein [Streptomyces sp. NPDC093990]|uniref:hypothetical protein n=1 Tax=Streptomyces sp. NPDC093990 TaxID=3155306 RepID=UPI0034354847